MIGCTDTSVTKAPSRSELAGSGLIPATAELLQRLSGQEPAVSCLEDLGIVASTTYPFPDGIGRGELIAMIFSYRGKLRLDIRLEHNRVFASRFGRVTNNRCFLNDYLASTVLPLNCKVLPVSFVSSVLSGVRHAGNAVLRHNQRHDVSWLRAGVAASSTW